jgi:hypothetical protein
MRLDGTAIAQLTRVWPLKAYIRVILSQFQKTPLGVGPSASRFGSPRSAFLILYSGRTLATALAETVIRDRFEGSAVRWLFIEEISDKSVVEISTRLPLRILDIRRGGCLKLGISTNVTGAKAQDEARAFSQYIYDKTDLDGILYASRLTGENCVAVYERAIAAHLVADRVIEANRLRSLDKALESLRVRLIV